MTAVAPRRKRLPPKERRAQLLEIAIDVVAERGLGEARHAEVAERAGVAVSTVFVYFPTRDVLIDSVIDEVATLFLAGIESNLGRLAPCATLLRKANASFQATLRTHRSHVVVLLKWGSSVSERVWPCYRDFTERYVEIVRVALERGMADGDIPAEADAESLARLYAASALSIARLEFSGVDPEVVYRFQETVLRAIFVPKALN